MDRDRLKEVHQTDLTESKVNEDFVDWMKNKGPTWLLVVLLGVCGYLAVVRYRQHQVDHVHEAWAAYFAADLPAAFEDVARDYDDVGHLASVARLSAAEKLLRSVQTGLALGATPPSPTDPQPATEALSETERTEYLGRAETLYRNVVDADTGTNDVALLVVKAMNGLAAIAESRGDAETARRHYTAAAERAGEFYPGLAQQASARAESSGAARLVTIPESAAPGGSTTTRTPIIVDDALRDLIMPAESDG
jgi:predicted negative regulator of RcsB-dependent stress response